MRLRPIGWQRPSQRTLVTLALIFGLLAALAYAIYLSYWSTLDISNAFAYQSAVVATQRDAELLEVEQFDRLAAPPLLAPYEKLLALDLERINASADVAPERPPQFSFPATQADYDRLTGALHQLEMIGRDRFAIAVNDNRRTRNLSNALFALIALLFAFLLGQLRETIEVGRSLVERLQRAFIARRRIVPNVDVGSVLISATSGSNVGGDTYDAFTYDNRYAMFVVADVSGKGVEAAVDTALIKYTLRTLFFSERDPGRMLTQFAEIYSRSAENPESFVVAFLAVLDLGDGTMHYASAGHEPAWAIVGQDVTRILPTGPIVGVDPHPSFATKVLYLRRGDALVLSTDGLTESRDIRRQLLGPDAVTVWLAELQSDAQGIADGIVRRMRKRSSRTEDDLAILVVRYAPPLRPMVPTEGTAAAIGTG